MVQYKKNKESSSSRFESKKEQKNEKQQTDVHMWQYLFKKIVRCTLYRI